jgi:hypothetical protein
MSLTQRYKSPLAIYVVWHPSFKKGMDVADYIYSCFSRDTEMPLSRGIGIPVYYRSFPPKGMKEPIKIPFNDAEYNAIIVLVDDELFNDDDWNIFVKDLIAKTSAKNRIFPIAFSSNAYFFEESTFGREQFIKAQPEKEEFSNEEFKAILKLIRGRLLHGFCRLLLSKPQKIEAKEFEVPAPVKLFISHAKKDNEKEAKEFRDFVRSQTKLSTFFDANDIADGHKFDTQLKKAIEDGHAALVVFHSDAYSTREWCQIEILTAKRYKTPIVIVHNITNGEKRSFPYMGNVPTIKFLNNNFEDIIDLTLYQILINIFHNENLKKIKSLFIPKQIDGVELSTPPELFNFIDILSKKGKSKTKQFIVLYPDPPLGNDEIRVLDEMPNNIMFLTPIQLSILIR